MFNNGIQFPNSKPIDPNLSYTGKCQHHKPCVYKINVVSKIIDGSERYLYRGSDCMERFVKTCRNITDKIMNELKVNVPIIMTEEDEDNFENATQCYLCGNEMEDNNHIQRGCKVRGHCHMTGKYRGCAHALCNLHFDKVFKSLFSSIIVKVTVHILLYVMLTNLRAKNSETFIMFGFDYLRFKGSLSFLSSSLDRLVGLNKYKDCDGVRSGKIAWKDRAYLDYWKENFKHSRNSSYVNDDEDLDILTDKGVYPYGYMNNWDKVNDTELSKKEVFYSKLCDEHIRKWR